MSKNNLELNLKDFLELVTDWNIKHKWRAYSDGEAVEGLCDPNNRTVYLSDDSFRANRQYTLLHELLHAHDFNRGYDSPERPMKKRTDELYRQIFGYKFLGKKE